MFFYWALSNYGRSFLLSAAWLALSVWLFHFGYAWILAPLMPQAGTLDAAKYAHAVCMVAVGNAVPFVGPLTIDAEIKKFLFCPGFGPCLPISPEGFQFLVLRSAGVWSSAFSTSIRISRPARFRPTGTVNSGRSSGALVGA